MKLFRTSGWAAGAVSLLLWGGAASYAQSANATDQDKQFLKDFSKDSNFEIATSKLALERSKSADVKQYAAMVEHDHLALKAGMRSADRAAGIDAADLTGMSSDDTSMYDKLKGLNGAEFDKAYIQELVKGNSTIEGEEKTQASDSKVPSVKALATKAAATDKKHAAKAESLAKAHGISS